MRRKTAVTNLVNRQ